MYFLKHLRDASFIFLLAFKSKFQLESLAFALILSSPLPQSRRALGCTAQWWPTSKCIAGQDNSSWLSNFPNPNTCLKQDSMSHTYLCMAVVCDLLALGSGCVRLIQQKTLSFQVGLPAWAFTGSVFLLLILFITTTTISKWGPDNLMHKMQGCIILRLRSRNRGWVGEESQLCCIQFAVFTKHAVVNFCSANLILYWMQEATDTLDAALQAVLYCTKLCGLGWTTCLLWALPASLGNGGHWLGWRPEPLFYRMLRPVPGWAVSSRWAWWPLRGTKLGFAFPLSIFLSYLGICGIALSLEWYWESFRMFPPEWCFTKVYSQEISCVHFFALQLANCYLKWLLGEIIGNNQSARAFRLADHWRIGIYFYCKSVIHRPVWPAGGEKKIFARVLKCLQINKSCR